MKWIGLSFTELLRWRKKCEIMGSAVDALSQHDLKIFQKSQDIIVKYSFLFFARDFDNLMAMQNAPNKPKQNLSRSKAISNFTSISIFPFQSGSLHKTKMAPILRQTSTTEPGETAKQRSSSINSWLTLNDFKLFWLMDWPVEGDREVPVRIAVCSYFLCRPFIRS